MIKVDEDGDSRPSSFEHAEPAAAAGSGERAALARLQSAVEGPDDRLPVSRAWIRSWGFYHQPRFGRPALALDLMEMFRPLDRGLGRAERRQHAAWSDADDFIRVGPAVSLTAGRAEGAAPGLRAADGRAWSRIRSSATVSAIGGCSRSRPGCSRDSSPARSSRIPPLRRGDASGAVATRRRGTARGPQVDGNKGVGGRRRGTDASGAADRWRPLAARRLQILENWMSYRASSFRGRATAAPLKPRAASRSNCDARVPPIPRSRDRGPIEVCDNDYSHTAAPQNTFRGRATAAPLKLTSAWLAVCAVVAIPRSRDRGPIEA